MTQTNISPVNTKEAVWVLEVVVQNKHCLMLEQWKAFLAKNRQFCMNNERSNLSRLKIYAFNLIESAKLITFPT